MATSMTAPRVEMMMPAESRPRKPILLPVARSCISASASSSRKPLTLRTCWAIQPNRKAVPTPAIVPRKAQIVFLLKPDMTVKEKAATKTQTRKVIGIVGAPFSKPGSRTRKRARMMKKSPINDLAPLTERWGNEYPRYGTIRGNDSRLFYFPINIVLGDLNLWLASTTGSTATYREAAYRYYKYINERNGDNSAYPTGINYYAWETGSTTWDGIRSRSSGTLTSENYATNSEIITMIAGDSIPAEGNYSELRNLFNSNYDNNYHVSIIPSQGMFELSESQAHCCLGSNGTTTYYAPEGLTNHRSGDLRLWEYYTKGWATNRSTGERMETSNIEKHRSQNIHIYRKYMLYLRFAEALNGAGFPRAAFQILSTGLNNEIKDEYVYPYCSESDSIWLSRLDFDNELYQLYTAYEYASPLGSDRSPNTIGIHTHGSGWTPLNEYYQLPDDSLMTEEQKKPIQTAFVDSLLLNENALELAFEGTRFYDIMRFALRQPNPGQFLAEKVAARRGKNNVDEALKNRLMDRNNWYLRWKGQIGIK